jgi:hypothetical protein
LFQPIEGAHRQAFGGATIDVVQVASADQASGPPSRHPLSIHLKPLVATEQACTPTSASSLADGSTASTAMAAGSSSVRRRPGHDAWVEADEDAVLIEFDFERHTSERLGLPGERTHH